MPAHPSSFRDPAGHLFTQGEKLYRQINPAGEENYRLLMSSGLYTELVEQGSLIEHQELSQSPAEDSAALIIEPRLIPYISYPYEWSFEQLKDAALLTLDIQIAALKHNLSLKDASGFNVQFDGLRPIFIDTLSFEKYVEGEPWVAYRQFCQHFLAPLALANHTDVRLSKLLVAYIDGVPLDLASKLLPVKSWFQYSLLSHIHLHAKAQARYAKGNDSEQASEQASPKPLS